MHYLPSPVYLNPFIIWYFSQLVTIPVESTIGGDINCLWVIDLLYKYKNFKFYGEFLADDIQYVATPINEPAQIGWIVGIHREDSVFHYTLEYTRVNAWTYLHENIHSV